MLKVLTTRSSSEFLSLLVGEVCLGEDERIDICWQAKMPRSHQICVDSVSVEGLPTYMLVDNGTSENTRKTNAVADFLDSGTCTAERRACDIA